jgi:hypothetical protein
MDVSGRGQVYHLITQAPLLHRTFTARTNPDEYFRELFTPIPKDYRAKAISANIDTNLQNSLKLQHGLWGSFIKNDQVLQNYAAQCLSLLGNVKINLLDGNSLEYKNNQLFLLNSNGTRKNLSRAKDPTEKDLRLRQLESILVLRNLNSWQKQDSDPYTSTYKTINEKSEKSKEETEFIKDTKGVFDYLNDLSAFDLIPRIASVASHNKLNMGYQAPEKIIIKSLKILKDGELDVTADKLQRLKKILGDREPIKLHNPAKPDGRGVPALHSASVLRSTTTYTVIGHDGSHSSSSNNLSENNESVGLGISQQFINSLPEGIKILDEAKPMSVADGVEANDRAIGSKQNGSSGLTPPNPQVQAEEHLNSKVAGLIDRLITALPQNKGAQFLKRELNALKSLINEESPDTSKIDGLQEILKNQIPSTHRAQLNIIFKTIKDPNFVPSATPTKNTLSVSEDKDISTQKELPSSIQAQIESDINPIIVEKGKQERQRKSEIWKTLQKILSPVLPNSTEFVQKFTEMRNQGKSQEEIQEALKLSAKDKMALVNLTRELKTRNMLDDEIQKMINAASKGLLPQGLMMLENSYAYEQFSQKRDNIYKSIPLEDSIFFNTSTRARRSLGEDLKTVYDYFLSLSSRAARLGKQEFKNLKFLMDPLNHEVFKNLEKPLEELRNFLTDKVG